MFPDDDYVEEMVMRVWNRSWVESELVLESERFWDGVLDVFFTKMLKTLNKMMHVNFLDTK